MASHYTSPGAPFHRLSKIHTLFTSLKSWKVVELYVLKILFFHLRHYLQPTSCSNSMLEPSFNRQISYASSFIGYSDMFENKKVSFFVTLYFLYSCYLVTINVFYIMIILLLSHRTCNQLKSGPTLSNHPKFQAKVVTYCRFSHDFTKIQTTKLLILLIFYSHEV